MLTKEQPAKRGRKARMQTRSNEQMTTNEFHAAFAQYTESIKMDLLASLSILNTMDKLIEAHDEYMILSSFPQLGRDEQLKHLTQAATIDNAYIMLRDKYKKLHDQGHAAAATMGLKYPTTHVKCETGEWIQLNKLVNVKEYADQIAAQYAR